MATILAVGRIADGDVHWRVAPITEPMVTVTDADVEALLDEVYGKPGLGVEDSAGLFDTFDYEGEADDYEADMEDRAYHGRGMW